MRTPDAAPADGSASEFTRTHWSIVLAAAADSSPSGCAALEKLCSAYWYPLYAYVRRNGRSPHDAQDLVQEFFARLLERKYLRQADQNRGRFRTFLLTSLKNLLINEWKKSNREKRGGGQRIVSLDDTDAAETRFIAEGKSSRTPDCEYDRNWAVAILSRVLERLQGEFLEDGKSKIFEELRTFLVGDENTAPYAEISERLGMSEGNLKVTVHRLRRRYREILREEVSPTVHDAGQIDEEIRALRAALSK